MLCGTEYEATMRKEDKRMRRIVCLLVCFLILTCLVHAESDNNVNTLTPSETGTVLIELPTPEKATRTWLKNRTKEKKTPEPVFSIPTPAPTSTPAPVPVRTESYQASSNASSDSSQQELTLSFVGDCSIGDALSSRKNNSSMTSCIRENGSSWLFSTVSDIFHADDFTFANLEVVLTDRAVPLYPLKSFNMIGKPEYAEILKLGGIDGVNTVNNHCIDFRYDGYEDTLSALEAYGIMHFGSLNPTRTKNRYVTLGRIEIKGVRIGLIGFTYPTNANLELISQDIQTLRSEGCQIVIVSLHWGREEHGTPKASQFPYAKQILDAGADMIWGHHPHVLQPVYFYQGKPIFFSTGNFVFGTIKALDPASGIFQLTWDIHDDGSVSLNRFHMVPTQIRHKKLEYRPLVLTDPKEMQNCLKHVVGNTDRYDCMRLPEEFTKTGTVYIHPDGSLSVDP